MERFEAVKHLPIKASNIKKLSRKHAIREWYSEELSFFSQFQPYKSKWVHGSGKDLLIF
jgi:hypothetical protein